METPPCKSDPVCTLNSKKGEKPGVEIDKHNISLFLNMYTIFFKVSYFMNI